MKYHAESGMSSPISPDVEFLVLSQDCAFTEGPLWSPDGYFLFSDTTANVVYKIGEHIPRTVFIENAGTSRPEDPELKPGQAGSNALAWHDGVLLVCRHGSHDIAQWIDGELVPFISEYKGRPLNSPNDIIVNRDGRIWFSDPPYGLSEGILHPEKYQPLAGLYCYDNGRLELWSSAYQYPNGVVLSPDESILYLCSTKAYENVVSRFDARTGQRLDDFARVDSDGIETDPEGNVYCCAQDGIVIFNPSGEKLGRIELPKRPANCAWGGPGGRDLLVTAREDIYLLKALLRG